MSATCCARASLISLAADEVLMPGSQELLLPRYDQCFNLTKFRRSESTTTSEAYGIKPELGTVRLPFHVNVRRLRAVGRVEEEPVRTLTMNGRHDFSVPSTRPRLQCDDFATVVQLVMIPSWSYQRLAISRAARRQDTAAAWGPGGRLEPAKGVGFIARLGTEWVQTEYIGNTLNREHG